MPIRFKTREQPVARIILEYKVDMVQDVPMISQSSQQQLSDIPGDFYTNQFE